jgi:hypothetical protein
MNLIINKYIKEYRRYNWCDTCESNQANNDFFFSIEEKKKVIFHKKILWQMSRLDFACALFYVYVCFLHLKFTVFFFLFFFFYNNIFLFNETRSKFELCIVNVNHNVVGLPTTSGFVLTLTRFVTRTYF